MALDPKRVAEKALDALTRSIHLTLDEELDPPRGRDR